MMRAFLAKRNVANKLKAFHQESGNYRFISFTSKHLFCRNCVIHSISMNLLLCFHSVQKDEKKEHHHLTDAEAAIAIQKGT